MIGPNFIIQYNMMNEESLGKLKAALLNNSIPHTFVGVIPFSHEITSDEPLEGTDYIVYGSTLMTKLTGADGLRWRGNYFNSDRFDYSLWIKIRNDMLNDGVYTLDEAINFLKQQEPESQWFTRPCEDLKQYSGQVIEAKECWLWLEDAKTCESSGTYQLSPTTKIILCKPKNIMAEWRWFVVDGKVVSGSMYRRCGQLYKKREVDEAVVAEAQQYADGWLPHRNCVMDLAVLDTGEVKVIEFNTINSSGFYDHDVDAIVKALWDDFVGRI